MEASTVTKRVLTAFAVTMTFGLLEAGCVGVQQTVEVRGKNLEIWLLSGKWEGGYESDITSRHGTISFELSPIGTKASGKIVMIPNDSQAYKKTGGTKRSQINGESYYSETQALSIEFVEVNKQQSSFVEITGGQVHGEVTPYFDPFYNRTVSTSFLGQLKGNTLKGTFTTQIDDTGHFYSGTWWAYRK